MFVLPSTWFGGAWTRCNALVWSLLLLTGCFGGEEPLPPHEALAKAAQRIDGILAGERARSGHRPPLEKAETPDDPRGVSLWFYTHPLASMLLSQPELSAAFAQSHPGIRFRQQFIGDWSVAIQKLTVTLAAGDLPDLALVKRSWLARLVSSGRIAPLDTLLPGSLIDDIRAPSRAALTANGRLYALPADGFCSVLYYNRQLVKDGPPRTWEELARIARQVSRPARNPREALYGIGVLPFVESLWSAGGNVCDELASGLDEAPARKALDFVLSLRREGLAYPRVWGDAESAFELFLAGRVAMTVASSRHLSRTRKAPFPVGVAPVPGEGGPISMLSDNAIVVFAKYANAKRAAIAEVLDFLTGPEMQGADALALGSVPVRVSVAKETSVPPELEEAYLHGRNTPLVGPWGAIEYELRRYLDLAYRWEPTGK